MKELQNEGVGDLHRPPVKRQQHLEARPFFPCGAKLSIKESATDFAEVQS